MIEPLRPQLAAAERTMLVALLTDAVDGGASVGFLPPLAAATAERAWEQWSAEHASGQRIILVGWDGGRIIASGQLALPQQPNASHRAEIQKVLVHSSVRRQGWGQRIMGALEQAARAAQRQLLVLDTEQGSGAEVLYQRLGYACAGTIPGYARSANGHLHATTLFYKQLDAAL